jgi:hypothetical protein
MRKIILLIVLAVLLTGCAIKNVSKTDYCHGKTKLSLSSSNGVFSLDEKYVYIFVRLHYYKPAVGICAFPDGGREKSIYNGLDIYKINLETGKTERLYALSDKDLESDTLYVSTSPNLFTTYKDNKYFYAEAHINKKNINVNELPDRFYFQVALDTDKVVTIKSEAEYKSLIKNVPKIQSSDYNKDGSFFNLSTIDSIPQFRLINNSNKTSKVILSGFDWLPYNFE